MLVNVRGAMVKVTPKQEQFLQTLKTANSAKEAYQLTHPKAQPSTAMTEASTTLSKPNVRARMMEILEGCGAGLGRVGVKLREHLENDRPMVSLESAKTILRVAGAFDDDDSSRQNADIQVNIAIVSKDGTTSISV